MHPQPVFRRIFLVPVLGVALIAALAACGGGSSGPKSGTSPKAGASSSAQSSPTSTSSPASGIRAKAQIKSNWMTFFNAKTPNAQRVKYLQNGKQFAAVLEAQSKSPMASEASAQVTKVMVMSPKQAEVVYSLLVGGKPALSNQKGIAVDEGGTWKVGDKSFCGLLLMENGGKASGLPKACSGTK